MVFYQWIINIYSLSGNSFTWKEVLFTFWHGAELEIGFNNRYLLDALKAAPAERLRINFGASTSPCVITPDDDENDSFLYMILPVRLKAGE